MSYYTQLVVLAVVNGLLAIAAYWPLAAGAAIVCLGAAMSLGAMAAGAFAGGQSDSLHIFFALVVAMLVGSATMGVIAGIVRSLPGFLLSVTTLALAELLRVIAQNQPELGGALGFRIADMNISPLWACGALFVVALIAWWFDRSGLRRALSLANHNPTAAMALGINISNVRTGAMVAGGAVAGLAGGLFLFNVGILEPKWFGFEAGIQILLFAIVGGTRSFIGPLLAGVFLTIAPEVLRISANQRMLIYGVLLIMIMVMRPEGRWRWVHSSML